MKKIDNEALLDEATELLLPLNNIEEDIQKCIGKPEKNWLDSEESINKQLRAITNNLEKICERLDTEYLPYLVFLTSLRFFDKLNSLIKQLYTFKFTIPENCLRNLSKIYSFINSQTTKYFTAFIKQVPFDCLPKEDEDIERRGQQDSYGSKNRYDREIKLQFVDQASNDSFKDIMVIVAQTISYGSKSSSSVNNAYIQILNYERKQKKFNNLQEQIALNFFKYELQNLRKDKQFICCKPIFIFQEAFEHPKKKFFQFKNFPYSKIQSKQLFKPSQEQQQLTRAITAFMNAKGGVIFIGISEETSKSSKICKITGFQMEQKNKKQVMKFIRAAVNEVRPKHKGFEEANEQNIGNTNTISINFYVSVQFINVVNKKFLENYNPQTNYKKVYVIKIIVKPGHQRYYYHLLVNQGNNEGKQQAQIQFVVRTQDGNSKQSIEKCYDQIYKKLIEYQKNEREGKIPERQPIHDGCRYDMRFTQNFFFLNDEDDDD